MAASATLHPRAAAAPSESPEASGTALLYERYYDRVFGYCLYQLGSREEAEDAAQTTFMWAFRGLRRGVVPRAEASWLFTIAQNACRARHRSRGRRREREVVSDPQLLADLAPARAVQHDELIGLEDALARMPELQRRALLLREWRGLSYKEIAEELELTGAAVETLIFRARRSLARLLSAPEAPKRARRFAFDLGSIGAALKASLGVGTVAKVAAGVAAAVIVTTVAGSSEHLRSDRGAQTGKPAISAAFSAGERLTLSWRAAVASTAAEPGRKTAAPKPGHAGPKQPTDHGAPPPIVVQPVEDTVTALPRTVDSTIGTLETTVGDTLGSVTPALPPAVTDALPPAGELLP